MSGNTCEYCRHMLSGSYPMLGTKCTCSSEQKTVTVSDHATRDAERVAEIERLRAERDELQELMDKMSKDGMTVAAAVGADMYGRQLRDAEARISELEADRDRWKEMVDEEIALTKQLMEALGVTFGDGPVQTELLAAIKALKDRATTAERELAALRERCKVMEIFTTDMAEQDCPYTDQPCLSVHRSQLSHGMCDGCRAREALAAISHAPRDTEDGR